jgi:hypothetical protein
LISETTNSEFKIEKDQNFLKVYKIFRISRTVRLKKRKVLEFSESEAEKIGWIHESFFWFTKTIQNYLEFHKF